MRCVALFGALEVLVKHWFGGKFGVRRVGPAGETLRGKEGAAAERTSLSAALTLSTSDLLLKGRDIPRGFISVSPTGFPSLLVSALRVSNSPLKLGKCCLDRELCQVSCLENNH